VLKGAKGSLTAVIAIAALLVLAGPAQGGPGPAKRSPAISTRTATAFGSGDTNVVTATAFCPKPKQGHTKIFPVGGGFQETPPSAGAEGLVFQSQLFGSRGWRVSTQIRDRTRPTSEEVALTAYVYCSATNHKLKTASSTIPTGGVIGGSPLTAVSCPSNDLNLVAGGFVSSLPVTFSNYMLRSSEGLGGNSGTWGAQVIAGTTAGQLTTDAYCAKTKPRSHLLDTEPTDFGAPDFSQVVQQTGCPKAKHSPVNGGFVINGARPTGLLLISASYKLGKKWRVAATLRHTPSDQSVVVLGGFAYC
jgi:hypothetical protein